MTIIYVSLFHDTYFFPFISSSMVCVAANDKYWKDKTFPMASAGIIHQQKNVLQS